jgi:aspartate-semialdehyde dehydrogenase
MNRKRGAPGEASHPAPIVGRMKTAVVGATGAVGRVMLEELAGLGVLPSRLALFASPRSAGTSLLCAGSPVPVRAFTPDTLAGCDLAFFCAGSAVSRPAVPAALELGVRVIDNSSAFRMEAGVPLVVPEVNGALLETDPPPRLVANPNCSTAQLVCALAPLERAFGLTEVVVSTYQSVSGTGRRALAALERESTGEAGRDPDSPYPVAIARNLIPWIGPFDGAGYGEEERKIREETRRILDRPDLPVHATAVRVPTRRGHGESVLVRLRRPVTRAGVLEVLGSAPGLILSPDHSTAAGPDGADGWTTPREAEGRHAVFVGRVRVAPDDRSVVQFWVISDNLLKGAAWNAVQIAQRLGLLPTGSPFPEPAAGETPAGGRTQATEETGGRP